MYRYIKLKQAPGEIIGSGRQIFQDQAFTESSEDRLYFDTLAEAAYSN